MRTVFMRTVQYRLELEMQFLSTRWLTTLGLLTLGTIVSAPAASWLAARSWSWPWLGLAHAFQGEDELAGDESTLKEGKQLADQGNLAEAAVRFRAVIGNPSASGEIVVEALRRLDFCRNRLQQQSEFDADMELALENHGRDYRVLSTVADQYASANHYGVVADQEFIRGYNRGYAGRGGMAGTRVSVQQQDRLRELQLRRQALEAARDEGLELADQRLARLHLELARGLLRGRAGTQAWTLQALTDLDAEPDYTSVDGEASFPSQHAPVDEAGDPIFYSAPENWEATASDGERARWALEQAKRNEEVSWEAIMEWADFSRSQFAVETLQQDQWIFLAARKTDAASDEASEESGVFAIHTLDSFETIAKLAIGPKRFALPEEHNFLALYQSVAEGARQANENLAERASWQRVNIFLNRRQYATAAEELQQHLEQFPERGARKPKQELLDSILQPRMQFDPTESQVAGQHAKLSLLFRNAEQIRFSAHRVDMEKLLADTKAYFRGFPQTQRAGFGGKENTSPPNLDAPVNLFDADKLDRYIDRTAAEWTEQVEPRENHWDKRIEVETPLQAAGLYVIDAEVGDQAHRGRCLLWIQDSILVRKPLDGQSLFQLVDAESGEGIPRANLEFFGYSNRRGGRNQLDVQNFAQHTDEAGQARVELDQDYTWLTVARAQDGRFAVLGTQRYWHPRYQTQQYQTLKAYGVSDRPLYRPGDTVKGKFWLARPAYGDVEPTRIPEAQVEVTMLDPQQNRVMQKTLRTDEYGGCEFEFTLPEASTLGRYRFEVRAPDFGSFQTSLQIRVEEYRKPEFEVEILSPSKPVALGETFQARVSAQYYFGAPVTDANVTVRVERSSYREQYYPRRPFDWCYGPGYWWFAQDYTWYPGFRNWVGCWAPRPDWIPGPWGNDPPELILEQQLELDETGDAKIEIDTALAKTIFGDQDHKYTLTAEVRDASRRTITSSGSVIAAREPFKIYSWTGRGYYRVGDTIEANFQARMLDGTPVSAKGKLDLLRIQYDAEAQPIENVVESFEVETDDQGNLTQLLNADHGGQYRLRLRLTDDSGRQVEGGYVFTVRGDDVTGDDFRYNALELTPDQQEYEPGDTVRLQVAANRENARVWLFLRPSSGVYTEPRQVQLDGKSTVVEIPVTDEDQPNFFVEAYTVYGGKLHEQVREIIVPPAERVLDVELTSNKQNYLPGEKSTADIAVRDPDGNPVSGSCVVAVYDRSLEQIAGDVLPEDIREFFWKWRRHHHPQSDSNAGRMGHPIAIEGVNRWQFLGIFGRSLADDADAMQGDLGFGDRYSLGRQQQSSMRMRGFSGGGMGGAMMEAAAAPAAEGEAFDQAESKRGARTDESGTADPESAGEQPSVRQDFADSALWLAKVETDAEGKAQVEFDMPENLTSWKIRCWAMSDQLQVGSQSIDAVTSKPLLVRLQTPRFLVERDEIVISSLVNNETRQQAEVDVRLEIDGETQIEFADGVEPTQTVTVEAGGQARVDWRLIARAEGTVTLRTIATSEVGSDAMQLELPIVVNGILKTESYAGTVRDGQDRSKVTLDIPAERRVEQSKLTVRLSPSLAASMIDALPYLAEYPYGCTEQTLNRFLPTVITQRILEEMQVDLATLAEKRRNNLNAQELGESAERNRQWKRFDREAVFDEEVVDAMVEAGVRRLTDMQLSDGGWGWFSGVREYSGAHTTATVVRGLLIAQENGVAIVPDVLQRGLAWLEQYQAAELEKLSNAESQTRPYKSSPDNRDALVFHVLVLAERDSEQLQAMREILYEQRAALSVYGKALVAWGTHRLGGEEQTAMLRRNIEQFLVEDPENETAFLNGQSSWWYWYGSDIEANAIYLKLLAALEPRGETAPRVVKYLLNNRKHATYWNSTRDTALVIEAFADYLRASDELQANMRAEVYLSGKRLGRVEFTPENLFDVDNTVEISGNAVPEGEHELEIRRSGTGNLYWNAYATHFTLEEEIEPAGLEVKIERRYYRVDSTRGELLLPGERGSAEAKERSLKQRIALEDLDELPSGSLVEVELLVQSKNDYEYLIIEDRKAASLEPVETQSGFFYSAGLSIYREMRDQHTALCIRRMPKGNYSIRYQMRSEAPGVFTALPATIEGMYAPELVGNSADFDLRVVDEPGE